MKKLVLISAIAMSGLLYNTANAQFGIHIGIHLFPHRVYVAPSQVDEQIPVDQDQVSYADNNDDFYYLPDVGAYYNVDEQLYYYFDGDNWITADCLPGVYRDYDWRDARRVEVREARPYMHNDFYRNQYNGFDCDLAHNNAHFREGFDFHQHYRDAYNNQPRFDDHRFDKNRGGNDQKFNNHGNDNRFDNRGQAGFDRRDGRDHQQGGQQFDQNRGRDKNNGQQAGQNTKQDKGNRDNQDRFAQNQKSYGGHNDVRAHF